MTKAHSNAVHSVQTKRCVSPFRKGTAREKAFKYLQKPRTYKQFDRWAKRIGVNSQNLLRALRQLPVLVEDGGTLRME